MLPGTMNMEFFGEGLKEISSIRVFYATIVGLIVGGITVAGTAATTSIVVNKAFKDNSGA